MANVGQLTATTANQQILASNINRQAILLKSPRSNTDRVYVSFGAASATTAISMPLDIGESIWMTSLVGQIRASTIPDAIQVLANTGSQDVRFIEF